MTAEHLLTQERRARMAAERLLAQKEKELSQANRQLSSHALALSEDLVETREKVEVAEVEKSQFLADLERANSEVDIAKRRLWNSIQSIEDGFAVYDADSRLIIANAAYLAPFDGLECVRPGAHYQEVIEAALYEGMIDIEGKSPTEWRDEMLARWFDMAPEPRVIRLWDGTWIRLVDHRAPGGDTVSLGLNITDTMRREAALEMARERAEAANRAKSAFLANMSHEIRTPMNGVVGMADLLADSGLDEEQNVYVDTIRSSGQALLSIINDVLDYSKIEANKLELHPEPFDLERTILDVLQLLEPSIREKKLKIMLDYDMFLPTRYIGDPVRMRQILTNLMGNAVKFTHTGHVLVRVVGLPDGARSQHRIHVTVEDTGIGIPADKLKSIFGEFNQVEDERNRAYEGTGLGLAITKQLVELMNGELWVESEEGVGSVFGMQVTMPVVDKAEQPVMPTWVKRALLVMDDDLGRDILEKRLVALGLRVDSTSRAASVDAPRANEADVIFADQRMSDMGAASFIAVLRTGGVTAPVILVAPTTAGRSGKVAGASAMLVKPISRPDLIDVLTALEQAELPDNAEVVESAAEEIAADAEIDTLVEPTLQVEDVDAPEPADAMDVAMPETPEVEAPVAVETAEPTVAQDAPKAPPQATVWIEELPSTADLLPGMPVTTPVADQPAPEAEAIPAPSVEAAPVEDAIAMPEITDMAPAMPDLPIAEDATKVPPQAPVIDETLATVDAVPEVETAPMVDAPAVEIADLEPTMPDLPSVEDAPAPGTDQPEPEVAEGAPVADPAPMMEAPMAPEMAAPVAEDLPSAESVETPAAPQAPMVETVAEPMDDTPSMLDALAQVTAQPDQPLEAPMVDLPPMAETGDNVVQMPVFGSNRDAEAAPQPAAEAPIAPQEQATSPEVPVQPAVSAEQQAAPAPQPAAPTPVAPEAPVPAELATPVAATADVSAPVDPAAPALRQMSVLAAEDNKTNRLIFSKLVKDCNIALRFATDGNEAIAAFEEEQPDLIFMDISMPGVDGTEATRRIRMIEAERGLPHTRVVALTAHAMEGDAEKILRHGLDRHLTKPLKKAEIFAEIAEHTPEGVLPPLPTEQ